MSSSPRRKLKSWESLPWMLSVMLLAPATVGAGLLFFRSVTATFILFHGGVCLGIPMLDIFHNRRPLPEFLREIGLTGFSRNFFPSLLTGIAMLAAVYFFFSALQSRIWDIGEISAILDRWGINRENPVPFIVMMVLGNAVLEEFFWRGYIISRLSRFMKQTNIILVSSAFYASYHSLTTGVMFSLPYAAASTASVFTAGLLWSYVRLKSGSLLFPVVTHLFVDLGIMLVYIKYLL